MSMWKGRRGLWRFINILYNRNELNITGNA